VKITAVQFKPILFDKIANLEKIQNFIETIPTNLIVFPELATTGYFFLNKSEVENLAEPRYGETHQLLQELSTRLNKIIVCGFAEKEDDKYYNSSLIVFPNKTLTSVYRKTHLFYKEKFVFTPGNTGFFNIYDSELNLNLGTMICYDWRFPESARTLALNGADLIVMPSCLVTKIWHRSMPSRALDNHLFFLVANRVGVEDRGTDSVEFNGTSVVYDCDGNILALADPYSEEVISADIDQLESRDKAINAMNDIFTDRVPKYYFLG
jgi:predicted amidohydrolase